MARMWDGEINVAPTSTVKGNVVMYQAAPSLLVTTGIIQHNPLRAHNTEEIAHHQEGRTQNIWGNQQTNKGASDQTGCYATSNVWPEQQEVVVMGTVPHYCSQEQLQARSNPPKMSQQRGIDYQAEESYTKRSLAEKLSSKKRTREELGTYHRDDTDLISQVTKIIQNLNKQGEKKETNGWQRKPTIQNKVENS